MPANNQKPASQTPASPRNTAKYTNKDGSKFITVPKGTPSESSQPSTPTTTKPTAPPPEPNANSDAGPAVNRKKQKRRQKAAAKAAAEQAANGYSDVASVPGKTSGTGPADDEMVVSDDEHEYVLGVSHQMPMTNGHLMLDAKSKKNRKKKKKNVAEHSDTASLITEPPHHQSHSSAVGRGSGMSRDKIWSTSNQEERERIKEFWLGLGEDERKSLVKVEKDAVLKKMKEQQKHTCSCTVCGRKRTAIEEELEGLYDAYYLELEQFANHGEGPPMLPPPRDFSLRPPRGLPSSYVNQQPSRGRIVEHVGDDEDEEELEDGYSEDEVEDDEYSDDEPPEEFHNSHERDVADFLTFGNSLQVKGTQLLESLLRRYGNMDLGGILTVADDLLKNDGKRFIEMMEQLAERRMAREEDAREHISRNYGHPNGSYSTPHSHPPPEDDEYDDDEDEEEDYDDSQDEEYEDEEVYSNPSMMPSQSHTECCCQDQMTEEQRMEEGRRMFQIFAARMFEQRVLSAYKEKIAKERQQKLLEELEEESRQVDQQKAKKAKNAQRKKDKAAQKKQALAEEKARKDAEKAEQEAARLEAEKQRAANQRQKAEEKRKQKEAQKKAEEEARLRKEAERQRRIQEQRDKQADLERKAREAKEREKKLKDEQRQKDKDAREQKDREAQERKDKQDRDKRDKEARAVKAQKEAQAAKEAKERAREEKVGHKVASLAPQGQPLQLPKRGQQHPLPIPTVLPQHPPNPASYASPKIPVATPVIPKAPTPIRLRTTSQQQDAGQSSSSASQSASATSQNPSPHSVTPAHMSPGPTGQHRKGSTSTTATTSQHSHSVSPPFGPSKLPGLSTPFQIPPMGMQPPPGLAHHAPPGFSNRMPHEPIFPPGFRPGPGMMMPPPGINGPATRGFPPVPMPPPGFSQAAGDQFGMGGGFPIPKEVPPSTHTRHSSGAFDGVSGTSTQPIGRPAPIGRPGSVNHGRSYEDKEDETTHLGSRALLEDDDPLAAEIPVGSLRNQPPGPRGGFPASPFMEAGFPMVHNPWGPSAGGTHPFPPPGFGSPGWGAPSVPPGFGMASPVPAMSSIRAPAQPRHVTVRLMMCQACKDLANMGDPEGYIGLATIKSQIDAQIGEQSIMEEDLLDLCDTEGSLSNGGGAFDVKRDAGGPGKHTVRWVPDPADGFSSQYRGAGAPGEIGSPLTRHASLRGI
ncbi:Stress response protein nst1 [Neonectria magnoliae]|uniref:Stress response protein NST1 n=1 Tax=Neonectria magnoliae TaxID=2732573 RepID=A0ABR1I765_9HYPO